ncbi:MAG TPA: PP2C family protein-serine/threonine phosphatase [Tepidisphaeraceae bacterium]
MMLDRMSNIAIPSEFDLELASERERWLRRRFLWFCALGIVVTIVFDVPDIRRELASNGRWKSGVVAAGECATSVLLYVAAVVYVLVRRHWRRPGRWSLSGFAALLVVAVGWAEMGFARARLDLLSFGDLPAGALGPAARGIVFASVAVAVLFTNHFFACLFMPWTFRESLRPAALLLAGFTVVLLADVVRRQLPAGGLLGVVVLAASFMPGAAICWWRFSRFRKSFTLRFESGRYRQFQRELQAARQLHESCLPPPIDRGPVRLSYAYEPMRQIGGDLLFVHRPAGADAILNLVVLDVTGHGIRAALTVNRLLGELERLFAESPDASPEQILGGLNRYVALTLSRHTIFATAFVARVDAAAGELRWASAGHPTAFVRRDDNGHALEPLESTATMLGVLEGDEYEMGGCRTALRRGDTLIAYTDGVCEACDRSGAQLGIDGTQRLIDHACRGLPDPNHWPGAILRSVLGYRGTPVDDDTLVVAVSMWLES